MKSKLMIATAVAVMSLATTAFAAGGDLAAPAPASAITSYGFDNTTLPENGSQGAVQSPNSLPPGFYNGTVQELRAEATTRWFAQQQSRSHYAQVNQAQPSRTPRS